jgi:alcohol dehydrogenase
MRAALVEKFGVENIKIKEVSTPNKERGFIRVKVKTAGINPIDYNVIAGKILYNLNPMPHIPGSEIFGEVAADSEHFKRGERVIVYNRIYDGTCDYCVSGKEYLCPSGGIYGVISNGGYAEEISIKEENVIRIPDNMAENVAVSLPIAALTPYHALRKAKARAGQSLLVYGASGNTGLFSLQLGKIMGMETYAVSSKNYLNNYGAKKTFEINHIPEDFKADMIINPLGGNLFSDSLNHVETGGSLITFGVQNGRDSTLDLGNIYTREINIIGTTGGSRKDIRDLIKLSETNQLRVNVDKIFPFDQLVEALKHFAQQRDGRVLLSF